jgi:CMP/dCMP kinase
VTFERGKSLAGTLTVSIDGPTASGKTTLGIELARIFGGAFIDTGLTYRALAYSLGNGELPEDDSWRLFIEHIPESFNPDKTPNLVRCEEILYRGQAITKALWDFEVDNSLENIARNPQRRKEITDYHRELISRNPTIIAAGRDVATTILTHATLHIFLNADFAVRRERRRAQHRSHPERSVVVGAITRRDLDTLAQIQQRSNSLVIDTTYLPTNAVLGRVKSWLDRSGEVYSE